MLSAENCGILYNMDKAEHGTRLAAAIAAKRFDRTVIADATSRDVRTVTNWTSGKTMPSAAERVILRKLLGDYDFPGDPVETAILRSELLTEDRRYMLLGTYKRMLREQNEETAQAG